MLKFLFGRYSRWVRLIEVMGVFLSGAILYRWTQEGLQSIPDYLFASLMLHYLFIRFCRIYSWYPGVKSQDRSTPELGIEVHFLKALVPTSYILLTTTLLVFLGLAWPATIVANLMMIMVSAVNGILIYFHVHDKDTLPVNYFTRSLILSDASGMTQQGGHNQHIVQMKGSEKSQRNVA